MCLDKVTKVYDQPNDEIVIGWKVFDSNYSGRILYDVYRGIRRYIGKEYKAKKIIMEPKLGNKYITGFHIYQYKKHAEEQPEKIYLWIRKVVSIKKVKGRNIMYKGVEDGKTIYVCEYMTILDE